MKCISWSVIIVSLILSSQLLAEWGELGDLTLEDKLFGLSLIWKEADYNYPHFDQLKDLDWDEEYKSFISRVSDTDNIYDYYRQIQEFTALLQDCHTRVIFPPPFSEMLDYPLVMLKWIEGRVIVSNVGDKYAESLPIGSQILQVDGIEVEEYLNEQVLPFISASNEAVLYNKAMSMFFFGERDSEVRVKFRFPPTDIIASETEERTGEVVLTRSRRNDRWSEIIDTREELLYTRWLDLDEEIYYVAIWSFHDELILRYFETILDELQRCSGLIIDLRENRRGRIEISNEILKYLTEKEILTGTTMESRKNIALYRAWGTPVAMYQYLPPEEFVPFGTGDAWHREEPLRIENDPDRVKITVPLVILTDSETSMAAEDFLVALLSARDDVKIVGTHTAGSRGQALIHQLPGGGYAWITTHRDIYGDDKILSRTGIEPDFIVEQSYLDYLQERDPVLEKGELIIREMLEERADQKSD